MLTELSIRDIVLIDKLTLSFSDGLNVLTGETGAGKSILLDSLGLALGARADRALVRAGCEKGVVTAAFNVPSLHPACLRLQELAVDHADGQLILKRQISSDGRSRAWINDEPVGQALLAEVAGHLVEIHGQHDDRGLLEATAHRALLDVFAGAGEACISVAEAYGTVRSAKLEHAVVQEKVEQSRRDEEYVRHAAAELEALAPVRGEEDALAEKRALMMQGEKASKDLIEFQEILGSNEGVDATVRGILRRLARLGDNLSTVLAPVAEALDRAAEDLTQATDALSRVIDDLAFNPAALDAVEERLFEYRRLARKHACQPDDLVNLSSQYADQLTILDTSGGMLARAAEKVAQAETVFRNKAGDLSALRKKAMAQLDALVNQELPPLKLDNAVFRTLLEPLAEADWNEFGAEKIVFEVKTNAGSLFGPMVKVASGGELARFILALKVVLSKNASPAVMVFDEVDRGIGGATASAVGERLKRLSGQSQLLVVTHSPQVAAQGDTQFQISKRDVQDHTLTEVIELTPPNRREEIARMLAGAEVTEAARAAAEQLLVAGGQSQ